MVVVCIQEVDADCDRWPREQTSSSWEATAKAGDVLNGVGHETSTSEIARGTIVAVSKLWPTKVVEAYRCYRVCNG